MPSRSQSSPRRSLARRACPPYALRLRHRAISRRRIRYPLASSACENTTVATRHVVSSRLAAARAAAPVDRSDRPDCGCLKALRVCGKIDRGGAIMATAAELRVPPLVAGDKLTRREFLRRWEADPEIKNAELIGGMVFMS